MEPIFGNHLGMVISNNDPEGRKRVQVFIPHLSNTLFKNWNSRENISDISFKNTVDLSKLGVLDKLKQHLPWAEAATPLFGGSTSMTSNSRSGNVAVNNSNNSSFTDAFGYAAPTGDSLPTDSTKTLTSNIQGNYVNSQTSPTIDPKLEKLRERFAQELNDPRKKAWFYSVMEAEVGGQGQTAQIMFAESVMNRIALRNASGIDSIKNYYGSKTQDKMSYDPNQTLNNKYDDIINNIVLKGSNYSNYATGNDQKSDVEQGLVPLGRGLGQATAKSGGEIFNIEEKDKAAVSKFIQADISTIGVNDVASNEQESNTNILDSQLGSRNATAAAQADKFTSASGSVNGVFSIPNEGAKVWVFFHGGDIQRPIYFATGVEG